MDAETLLNKLRKRENLLEYSVHGNKKIWFAKSIPSTLPIGSDSRILTRNNVPMPYGHYRRTEGDIAGWMSYSRHTGGKISSVTAFVSISPLSTQQPLLQVSQCEPMGTWKHDGEIYQFGLSGEWLAAFSTGIEQGVQAVLSHPLADVEVKILNAIVDSQRSDLKAFEYLGQRLIEKLAIELYREYLVQKG